MYTLLKFYFHSTPKKKIIVPRYDFLYDSEGEEYVEIIESDVEFEQTSGTRTKKEEAYTYPSPELPYSELKERYPIHFDSVVKNWKMVRSGVRITIYCNNFLNTRVRVQDIITSTFSCWTNKKILDCRREGFIQSRGEKMLIPRYLRCWVDNLMIEFKKYDLYNNSKFIERAGGGALTSCADDKYNTDIIFNFCFEILSTLKKVPATPQTPGNTFFFESLFQENKNIVRWTTNTICDTFFETERWVAEINKRGWVYRIKIHDFSIKFGIYQPTEISFDVENLTVIRNSTSFGNKILFTERLLQFINAYVISYFSHLYYIKIINLDLSNRPIPFRWSASIGLLKPGQAYWLYQLAVRFFSNLLKTFILNFGPQHPSSHGVLRLVLWLEGELIRGVDPHIGFLHRGSEKLMEMRDLFSNVVYIDRLDYTSVLTQTHAYCLSVETLVQDSNISLSTSLFRTIFDELARILNHLLSLAAHTLDVGSMVPLFWAFEERERIMEIFEYVSGARMHAAFYFPGQNLNVLLTTDFAFKILFFLRNCQKSFTEMYIILYGNRVWKLRLVNVGRLDVQTALSWGTSGPVLRSTGVSFDLRLTPSLTYGFYTNLPIISYLGICGDCYDRFLIRSRELFEASRLIYLLLSECCYYNYLNKVNDYALSLGTFNAFGGLGVEALSKLFNIFNNFKLNGINLTYRSVESGKGIFSIGLLVTGGLKPYRIFIRSPALQHLSLLNTLVQGHYFADLVTILGSLDLVFGEIDK